MANEQRQVLEFATCLLRALPKEMDSATIQWWIENPSALQRALAGIAKLEIVRRLAALIAVEVPANEINPHEFFKNRPGLWISDDFHHFILSGATKEIVSTKTSIIGYADLKQLAKAAEIREELGDGHVFVHVMVFLAYLATLIKNSLGGGMLVKNGKANIFYVEVNGEVFSVNVFWVSGLQRWDVYVFPLGSSLGGHAGDRAFSATAPRD